jgi:hypothetical protein
VLAPSLFGLAAGLLLGRLVPVLLGPAIRSSAESPDIGRFLAVRELKRDRAAWRMTAMVSLAMSLLSFAVIVSHGASIDRTDRAGLIVGASRVANVAVPPGQSLLSDVDRADPAGDWAAAAELLEPFGSAAQRTLAVDTTRLAAVAGWSRRIAGYTPAGLHRFLHVPPNAARLAVPLLTAGNVGGSTLGLNNLPLRHVQVQQTSVLPELLDQGALADLRSLIAVAKPVPVSDLGVTQLVEQVWMGPHAPPDALARLRAAGLTVNSVSTRAAVAAGLDRRAQTAGLSAYLAVAVLAAVLAIALLAGTGIAAANRQQTETIALASAGVSRWTVVRGRGGAAAVRLTLSAIVALTCGILTVHLAARLVPQAAAGSVPAAILPLPILPALVAVVATLIAALLAEMGVAAYAARPHASGTPRTAMA